MPPPPPPLDQPARFLHVPVADLAAHTAPIKNGALRETLQRGVAFYHEGLSEAERACVRTLFATGAVQICVVEHALCWGLDLSAYMVIVMDTQKYNGAEHRYVDYAIPDLLQVRYCLLSNCLCLFFSLPLSLAFHCYLSRDE